MSQFSIQRATRRGVIPLIGLYGESGTGKSMSALLLARGLVGPTGEIHAIDTESRRLSLYADVIPGGFSVLDFEPPFSPERYIEAMKCVVQAGAKVIVIDSMSHEWEGEGGVLDMAAESEREAEEKAKAKGWTYKPGGLGVWKQPKFQHAKLVQFLLRAPVPVVCCIRAKYKTRQKKDHQGKTQIVKDEFTSPIQAEDFIFEMTAHAEVLQDHSIHLSKCSHPDLRKCFPSNGPITVEHGRMIAEWCAAGSAPQPTAKPDYKALKAKLWKMTASIHKNDPAVLEKHLKELGFIREDASLDKLTELDLERLIQLAEKFV